MLDLPRQTQKPCVPHTSPLHKEETLFKRSVPYVLSPYGIAQQKQLPVGKGVSPLRVEGVGRDQGGKGERNCHVEISYTACLLRSVCGNNSHSVDIFWFSSLLMFAKNVTSLLSRIYNFSLTFHNRLVLLPPYPYGDGKTCKVYATWKMMRYQYELLQILKVLLMRAVYQVYLSLQHSFF